MGFPAPPLAMVDEVSLVLPQKIAAEAATAAEAAGAGAFASPAMAVVDRMVDEFGPERVRNTPISEMALAGTAIGAAIASGVIFATSGESAHVVAAPNDTGTGGSVFYVGTF